MFWRREIRMRTIRFRCGKLQHLRPEGSEQNPRLNRWLRGHEPGARHPLEIVDHVRIRLRIVVLAHTGNEVSVADTKTQHEPTREGFSQGALPSDHRHRVAGVHVRNSGCDNDALGCAQQNAGMSEGVASDRFGEPQCPISEGLCFLNCFSSLR